MLEGVPTWRYGPRVTEALADPASSRSKRMSELVPFAWWISTASTFVPAARRLAGTLVETNVVVSEPARRSEANVEEETAPAGMLLRKTSVPLT